MSRKEELKRKNKSSGLEEIFYYVCQSPDFFWVNIGSNVNVLYILTGSHDRV